MYFDHIYPLLKLNKCSNEYNKGHGSMMKEGVLSVPKKKTGSVTRLSPIHYVN